MIVVKFTHDNALMTMDRLGGGAIMEHKDTALLSDDATGLLGVRLRHARLVLGLRLKDVAERAHCSESLVSKIERGHTTPSLKVLHRLTRVLDISISTLFSPGDVGSVVWRAGERPVITLQGARKGEHIHLERIVPHYPGLLLEANIHVVEPGAKSDGAIEHAGEEMGYILQGSLDLWVENDRYRLHPGDAFHFRSDLGHRYCNPGDEVTKVLWVNSPPTF